MRRTFFFEHIANAICVVLALFVSGVSLADEILEGSGSAGLAPMAGAGGVMRDAERRIMTPVPVKRAGPEAEDEDQSAEEDDAEDEEENVSPVLGKISNVQVFGATEFCERNDVVAKILEAIGEGVQTEDDVHRALAKVRNDFMKAGFYLVRMSPSRGESYNRETETLSVLVDEGRFGELTIRFWDGGDGRWFSKSQIENRFKNIDSGTPFNYGKLRNALFEANSHPDLTIDTRIDVRKPIEGEGYNMRIARYADIDLEVRESFPMHMIWEVNNYGMEEVEEWQTSLTLQYLNLTKHDDVLTISPSTSMGGELMSVAASYMVPHNWWNGGNTTFYGGWSQLDVDDILPRLDLEGTGYFFGLQHSEKIYETDRHMWLVSAGILWRYIEDQYTAMETPLDSRNVTIMPASLALSYTGKKPDGLGGRNFANIQGVFNICSTGDKLEDMWTDAEENYWILRWQLARLQPLFGWWDDKTAQDLHQWMLFMKLEGQYTSDVLIPTEKLSMGGYNTMRGYHTRGYIGDYGVYGTTELRTPILVDAMASLWGDRTDKSPIDRLQFLGFLDYGWTAFNDLPSGYDDNEFLVSAGFGARASVTKYTQLKCDVAFPLHDAYGEDDDSVEVYFSMQVQF